MELNNKNILVYGFGISGISTLRSLSKYRCNLTLLDSKSEEDLADELELVKDLDFEKVLGQEMDLSAIDLLVKSPGIPPSNKILLEAREKNIPVITDLELGYLLSKTENIIAITGTNGKTSTTSLVGEIFTRNKNTSYVCGNIGVGILDTISQAVAGDIVSIECSSFQLEDTRDFKPRVAVVINLSPDHINWHGDYEKYIEAKLKVYKNQGPEDISLINYDDEILRTRTRDLKSKKIYFSSREKLDRGIYLDQGYIVYNDGSKIEKIVATRGLDIFLENALVAVGIALALGVEVQVIEKSLREFKALAHRMEYVDKIRDVDFYNDSKGTNPDSTISGLKKIEKDIILIAGGYDKGSDFSEMLKIGKDKIHALVLLGETKKLIERQAREVGYEKIYIVENMQEAVKTAYNLSHPGMAVVLSPACASWGMYNNFEERGDHFKKIVEDIKVAEDEKNKKKN